MEDYQALYARITEYALKQGPILREAAGKAQDVGDKPDQTEHDLRIEDELRGIVMRLDSSSRYYAEEMNGHIDSLKGSVVVADPISSTKAFGRGLVGYAIVVSHLIDGQPQFGLVYVPSTHKGDQTGTLYTAQAGKGARKNNEPLILPQHFQTVETALRVAPPFQMLKSALRNRLQPTFTELRSVAYEYCLVAEGRHPAYVCLAKDWFPHPAGGLIAREAGCSVTNASGQWPFGLEDRVFIVAGGKGRHAYLLQAYREVTGASGAE